MVIPTKFAPAVRSLEIVSAFSSEGIELWWKSGLPLEVRCPMTLNKSFATKLIPASGPSGVPGWGLRRFSGTKQLTVSSGILINFWAPELVEKTNQGSATHPNRQPLDGIRGSQMFLSHKLFDGVTLRDMNAWRGLLPSGDHLSSLHKVY